MEVRLIEDGATQVWVDAPISPTMMNGIRRYALGVSTSPSFTGMTAEAVELMVVSHLRGRRRQDATVRTMLYHEVKKNRLNAENWFVVDLLRDFKDPTVPVYRRFRVATETFMTLMDSAGTESVYYAEIPPMESMAIVRPGPAMMLARLHGYKVEPLVDFGLIREESYTS